jgi:hypothetical protein
VERYLTEYVENRSPEHVGADHSEP